MSEKGRRGRGKGARGALLFLLGLAVLGLTAWLVVFFECKISG